MDLGSLSLKPGKISEPVGRTPEDNSVGKAWIAAAGEDGKAKALTVPGTVEKNAKGKTIYTGVADEVVKRLRKAADSANVGTKPEDCIGVRIEVVPASAGKVTVNFQVTKKVFRPRKAKAETTPEMTENPAE